MARNRHKMYKDLNKKKYNFLFPDDRIVYLENAKEFIKELLMNLQSLPLNDRAQMKENLLYDSIWMKFSDDTGDGNQMKGAFVGRRLTGRVGNTGMG